MSLFNNNQKKCEINIKMKIERNQKAVLIISNKNGILYL